MNRLANKVAVITGGNNGIGFVTAQQFIAEGAQVVITGRNPQAVQEAVAKLGSQAVGIVSDAGRMADVRQLAAQVQAHHQRVDVLFVNAGVSLIASVTEVDEAHFDEHFNINVKGAFFTVQQLLPLLNDGGSIIFNASATAHRAFPNNSVYAATKGALLVLTRNFALELVERKIRVNAVSPGPIATLFNAKSFEKMGMSADAATQAADSYAGYVPLKRLGQPEEIAAIVTFLASDDAGFVTGGEIIAGGGIGTL